MAYKERLARNYDEVVKSTKSFSVGLNGDPRLHKRLSNVKAWYYIPENDAVGPSKFIGYRDMNADFYLAHTGKSAEATLPRSKRLDGRATEPVLKKWFEVTDPSTAEHKYVSDMTKELLDKWDKRPSSIARYCVPIGFRMEVWTRGTLSPGKGGFRTISTGRKQMNQLLREAFEKAAKLPEGEQDRIARLLLDEMESDRRWEELFATPESEAFLERMADEAIAEHRARRLS